MAALKPAEDRIAYLLGFSSTNRRTPNTITGTTTKIKSYNMDIVVFNAADGDEYMVHIPNNSPTTNRHIKAAANVLQSHGWLYRGMITRGTVTDDEWASFAITPVPAVDRSRPFAGIEAVR